MAFLKITKPKEYSRVLTEALRFGKKKVATKIKIKKKKEKKLYFNGGINCERSFQELKNRLVAVPILAIPSSSRGFVVYRSASR